MSNTTIKKTKKPRRRSAPSASYLALIQEFPLRSIHDDADYEAASVVLDRLAIRGEKDLDPGEADYLDALSVFIERYDEEHYPMPNDATPLENLKFLLSENKMNTTDLGELLGNRGLASLILNGKREISKANIRVLADRFKVSAALFF